MDHGALIAAGPPAAIQRNERVIDAYLGNDTEAEETAGTEEEALWES